MALSLEGFTQLLYEATSAESASRAKSLATLQGLQQSQQIIFFSTMFDMLKSRDKKVHVLAYSYLLHEVVIKFKKISPSFMSALQETYVYFEEMNRQEDFTFGTNMFELPLDNVINLAAAVYSKPSATNIRNEFFQETMQTFPILSTSKKAYFKHLIERLVEILPIAQKKRSTRLGMLFQNVIYNLWQAGGLSNFQLAIDLSYFMAIFPQDFWKKLLSLLYEEGAPQSLIVRIINRCFTAIALQHHSPNIRDCFRLHQKVASLLFSIILERISEENLAAILGTVYYCLRTLQSAENLDEQETQMRRHVIDIKEFHKIVGWIINSCGQSAPQDEENKLINQRALDIITFYSQALPEEDLEKYFKELHEHFNYFREENMLFLLSGAQRKIHQLFNANRLVELILTDSSLNISTSHLLFLERFILNEHYLDDNVLAALENFLKMYLTKYEFYLSKSLANQVEAQNLHKISIILSTFILTGKYSRSGFEQNHFIEFVCTNVFKYLSNAPYGLLETAYEKLYDSLIAFISFQHQKYNYEVCVHTIKIYHDSFITVGGLSAEKQRTTSRVRQQFLYIITKTLSSEHFQRKDIMVQLKAIITAVNPQDLVISKEILFLLGKYMRIYNYLLTKLQLYEMLDELNNNKDFFNPQLKYSVEQIFFSGQLKEFLTFLEQNLQYDFAANINKYLSEFFETLKVLIELSVHPSCFIFVEEIALKLIYYLTLEADNMEKLNDLARKKHVKISFSIYQLKRLPVYLDCMLQILYLNPRWRHNVYMSDYKHQIVQSEVFKKCKDRIDSYLMGDITKMMEQVSIQNSQKKPEIKRWDRAYFDILNESGVGEFCEVWINILKEQQI